MSLYSYHRLIQLTYPFHFFPASPLTMLASFGWYVMQNNGAFVDTLYARYLARYAEKYL